jgi:hypothetical protein
MDQDLAQFRRMQKLDCAVDGYSELGGLRLVPIALLSLLMASFVGGVVVLPAEWTILLGGVGLQLAVFGYWLIARWYRDNYGMTRKAWPSSRLELARWLSVWMGASLMVLSAIDGSGVFMEAIGYLAGLAAMAWVLLYWRRKGEMWPQSYALMMLFAIGAILHQAPPIEQHGLFGLLLAFMSVTLFVASGVGHGRLEKERKSLEDGDE